MKLNALRDFIAVAERGSLRAAARQLGVAQPAMTRNIRELEKSLGVALFERHPTGVALSAMGKVFLRRVQAAQKELQRARDEIEQLKGETNGKLRICLSTVSQFSLLPYALSAFRERYPHAHIEIIDALWPRIEHELTDGVLDFYVGPLMENSPNGLIVKTLFDRQHFIIVGRREHPLANAMTLAELAQAEWLTSSLTHLAEDEITPLFTRQGLPSPRIALKAESAFTFLTVLANTDLLMILPQQWLETQLLGSVLQKIDILEPLLAPSICLVYRSGLPLTPAAEYFCDMLQRASTHIKASPSRCHPAI